MNLHDFILNNIFNDIPLVNAIAIGFLFVIVYDFYHTLTSAILTIFKRK